LCDVTRRFLSLKNIKFFLILPFLAPNPLTIQNIFLQSVTAKPAAVANHKKLAGGLWQSDFDGDGKADFSTWRAGEVGLGSSSSSGFWQTILSSTRNYMNSQPLGGPGDIPVVGDYDGDGKADHAVFSPSTGLWTINASSAGQYTETLGASNTLIPNVPVIGDYNGDGKTDIAVFIPAEGMWEIALTGGSRFSKKWGEAGDVPVPGDYDGDGVTDFAYYRTSTNTFHVLQSSDGAEKIYQLGHMGDILIPADYDGDGKTDPATFETSTREWTVIYSSTGQYHHKVFGEVGDIPVPADFDGDLKANLAVFRPSNQNFNVDSVTGNSASIEIIPGYSTDAPLPISAGRYDILNVVIALSNAFPNALSKIAVGAGLQILTQGNTAGHQSFFTEIYDPLTQEKVLTADREDTVDVASPGWVARVCTQPGQNVPILVTGTGRFMGLSGPKLTGVPKIWNNSELVLDLNEKSFGNAPITAAAKSVRDAINDANSYVTKYPGGTLMSGLPTIKTSTTFMTGNNVVYVECDNHLCKDSLVNGACIIGAHSSYQYPFKWSELFKPTQIQHAILVDCDTITRLCKGLGPKCESVFSENVIVHELGHVFGLGDDYHNPKSIMQSASIVADMKTGIAFVSKTLNQLYTKQVDYAWSAALCYESGGGPQNNAVSSPGPGQGPIGNDPHPWVPGYSAPYPWGVCNKTCPDEYKLDLINCVCTNTYSIFY
jgi:hypothetical protein